MVNKLLSNLAGVVLGKPTMAEKYVVSKASGVKNAVTAHSFDVEFEKKIELHVNRRAMIEEAQP